MEINKFYINGKWATPNGQKKLISIILPLKRSWSGSFRQDDVNAAIAAANVVLLLQSIFDRKKQFAKILDGMMKKVRSCSSNF